VRNGVIIRCTGAPDRHRSASTVSEGVDPFAGKPDRGLFVTKTRHSENAKYTVRSNCVHNFYTFLGLFAMLKGTWKRVLFGCLPGLIAMGLLAKHYIASDLVFYRGKTRVFVAAKPDGCYLVRSITYGDSKCKKNVIAR